MAFRKNRPAWIAIIAILICVPLIASALIAPKHLGKALRTSTFWIPSFQLAVVTANNSTDTTQDTNGVIAAIGLHDGTRPIIGPVWTSSIAALPYPSKLRVMLKDGSNDSTLTCATVTIVGKDQFGVQKTDTLSTLTESVQTGARVLESVSRITAATCAGGEGTDDTIQVSTSAWVGLPQKIRTACDLISVCYHAQTADALCFKGCGTDPTGNESFEEAAAIDYDDDAIDLADATLDTAIAEDDVVSIRMRPNVAEDYPD